MAVCHLVSWCMAKMIHNRTNDIVCPTGTIIPDHAMWNNVSVKDLHSGVTGNSTGKGMVC